MKSLINKIQNKGFDVINYFLFGVYAFVAIYPLYFIYINAISDNQLVASGQIKLYPKQIDLRIFTKILI